MNVRRSGALLGLALFWSRPSNAADPVGLRVVCDGGTRFGAAGLVRDFRPGHEDDLLIMTALHVLQGCAFVAAKKADCSGRPSDIPRSSPAATPSMGWGASEGAGHPADVLVWQELDVAAIVVPAEDRGALVAAVSPLALGATPEPAPADTGYYVIASGGINVCPLIPTSRRDVFTAQALYESLPHSDYYALFGSLDTHAWLMSYQGTVVAGTSGGPVVSRLARQNLVAVHLGGQPFALGWGILVGSDVLLRSLERSGAKGRLRLDEHHPFVVDGFAAPTEITEASMRSLAALDVNLHRDALLAMLETSTPVDPFGAVAVAPQVGWSRQWFSPGFAPLRTAFGTRVLLGGVFGQYRSPMKGLQTEEAPQQGTARLPFYGGFGEVDAELHVARLSPVQGVVSVGIRGGLSHQRYVGDGADAIVWGPVVSGRVQRPFGDRIAGVVQLHLAVEQIPVSATPMNCIGNSVSRPAIWDAWAGVAVGVEIRP